MEANNLEALARFRSEMEAQAAWTREALAAIEREQFAVTRVRRHNRFVWFVWTAPPAAVQAGFGLAPELLLVFVNQSVRATDVTAAAEEVFHSELRLDGNLIVVSERVSDRADTSLKERLARIGGHGQRIAWVAETGGWPSLRELLKRELPAFDAYEERDPVRGAQLVGRAREVTELRTRVVRGDAVGLFGLRKMGKTSVLRAVTDLFDPASGMTSGSPIELPESSNVAVVLDAGVLVERTVDGLAEELLRTLAKRMKAAGEPIPPRTGHGIGAWKAAVETLLDEGRHVCVVIDEYDLLFEGEGGEGVIAKLNQFFRLMRGWSQMNQGRASLVLVGRDATFLSSPEIDGVTNALLMWCTPMWLGPLAQDKATELLRKLGKRVGLSVGAESARLAFTWTGGHPLLQRQFGSELRAQVRARNADWGAVTDAFGQETLAPYRGRDAVQEVVRETVALLHKRYPQAYALLEELAHGPREAAVGAHGGVDGEAARVLANFGLVSAEREISETLRWYLVSLSPTAPVRRVG
jgi:hypothetical protein